MKSNAALLATAVLAGLLALVFSWDQARADEKEKASPANVTHADAKEAAKLVAKNEVVVLDVRTPGEFAAAPNSDRKAAGALVLIALVSLPLLAVFPLLGRRITQPLVYSIRAGTLHVPGNLWTVKMALRGATFTCEPLGRAWRVAGTALPGLLLGAFRAGGKNVHVAARDLKSGVRVETADRTVYVTPSDMHRFCAELIRAGAQAG